MYIDRLFSSHLCHMRGYDGAHTARCVIASRVSHLDLSGRHSPSDMPDTEYGVCALVSGVGTLTATLSWEDESLQPPNARLPHTAPWAPSQTSSPRTLSRSLSVINIPGTHIRACRDCHNSCRDDLPTRHPAKSRYQPTTRRSYRLLHIPRCFEMLICSQDGKQLSK